MIPVSRLARYAIAGCLAVFTLLWTAPVLWMGVLSLRASDEFYKSPYGLPVPAHWDKFLIAWVEFGYQTYFRNSLIVSITAVLLLIAVGSMAAYFFARYKFPFKEPLYMMIFAAILLPPQVPILALFQMLVRYHLYNTLTGLILVYAASGLPVTLFLLRAFFAQIPLEIEEAARIEGATDWRMYWQVMFRNEFLYAVVLINQQASRTLPLGIMFFMGDREQDVGMIATGLVITILPVFVLYAIFSERITQSLVAGALGSS
ncbi:MAG: carbohydrate ABC transporter permease [Bacillati bacterium ANGP1]|uniref:Carbohydrate ABC transporter permease n=1 Tax=Candidatus Segetimicrobium genomatis TaxID=2569760 RepID=A0A537J6P4_9BACT|nr:MAG: carbohydrate ABC transporter permease [Terrabacteria group bacterium ANGP1]